MGILWDILNEIDDRTHTCDPVNDEPYMYVDDVKEIISKHMTDNIDGNLSEIGSTLNKIEAEHPYKVPGDYDTYSQYNEGWCDAINRVRGDVESLGNGWIPVKEQQTKETSEKRWPVGGVDRTAKTDKITLETAVETPFWMAIWATEPYRMIEVEMSYSDLKIICDLIDKERRKRKGEQNE